jgi:NifB/MoaA-like Fe-S oxidoreductase
MGRIRKEVKIVSVKDILSQIQSIQEALKELYDVDAHVEIITHELDESTARRLARDFAQGLQVNYEQCIRASASWFEVEDPGNKLNVVSFYKQGLY